jgi:hypothetical protein
LIRHDESIIQLHGAQSKRRPSFRIVLSIGLMYDKTCLPFEASAYHEAVRINPSTGYHWASGVHSRNYDAPHEYLSLKKAFRAASADRFHITALSNHLSEKHESYAVVQFMKEGLTADLENLTAHAFLASALYTLGERHQAMEVRQHMLALSRIVRNLNNNHGRQSGWGGIVSESHTEKHPVDSGRPSPHRELSRLYKKQDRFLRH